MTPFEAVDQAVLRGLLEWGGGSGTPHDHAEFVEGCFRCDLNQDEL